ncbi:hypothetical protein KIN20_030658 [Parelaphostrongylus tenuis]|uniref:Large ribosomal subunit protein mL40 n=1 Tax=Parelaphostrongylus tenuis TaxID=148309 RepID=A0AAD5WGA0_PARTN|nr:hypothetical protein KIN20_030658 [Parelaphostrongylus tenuis]
MSGVVIIGRVTLVEDMNPLCFMMSRFSISPIANRTITSTPLQCSVFMKKQKKVDPEPKPVDELLLDVKSAKNINERYRDPVVLTEEQIDERAIALKDYTRSRNHLQRLDDQWVRNALRAQKKALNELKFLDLMLYEKSLPLLLFIVILNAGQRGISRGFESAMLARLHFACWRGSLLFCRLKRSRFENSTKSSKLQPLE